MQNSIYDEDYTEDKFIEKIDNHIELDEYELRNLIDQFRIDEIEHEDHRWQRRIQTIVKLKDRYFSIFWYRALTEIQENSYWNQPVEVELQVYEKTIAVTQWIPISEGD